MTEYRFSAVIGHDEDGYWGQCPELQGCYTQGITFEEAVENLKEAIVLHVEDRLACGEEIPRSDTVSLLTLDVAV
ncbi:MAG: type II toxin-antitoxin system HicB family antitoxin [Thermoleophilia bacterium]|nr:type II toxin-antitoxin system HicB family antitoxin [Thermoleophilia bacterium]